MIRAAAVRALASYEEQRAIFDAAKDKSWRVRLVVAKVLGRYPSRAGAALAMEMLDDPSATVQQAAVASLADRQSIRLAALTSLPKVVGYDAADPDNRADRRLAERIEMWKRWYADRSP